jgi:hypothetical protein
VWDEIIHPVERPQKGGLAAARGPNEGRNLSLFDLEVDILQGLESTVEKIQAFGFHLYSVTIIVHGLYIITQNGQLIKYLSNSIYPKSQSSCWAMKIKASRKDRNFTEAKVDEVVKSQQNDGFVKSSRCKARKN